jgi:hypothetical protein
VNAERGKTGREAAESRGWVVREEGRRCRRCDFVLKGDRLKDEGTKTRLYRVAKRVNMFVDQKTVIFD